MKALGGSFDLHSTPGQGTRVTLTLPWSGRQHRLQPAEATIPPRLPQVANPRAGNVKGTRVLLVDDHAMVRQGLRAVLEGYDDLTVIGEACDGQEALTAVDELHPDVVVMDINMPGMNGIEATAHICQRYPTVRVIGLSVNASRENEQAIREAGAAMLLTKEAAVEQLYSAIQLPTVSLSPTVT
jgi:CheY-like chemotaxis protein